MPKDNNRQPSGVPSRPHRYLTASSSGALVRRHAASPQAHPSSSSSSLPFSGSPAPTDYSRVPRFVSPIKRGRSGSGFRSLAPVGSNFPAILGAHLDVVATEISRLVGDQRGGTGGILHLIFDQAFPLEKDINGQTLDTHGFECMSPPAHVREVLRAMYSMVLSTVKSVPRSQAGNDAILHGTWWPGHRAYLISVGGNTLKDVQQTDAALVLEVAAFEWVRREPLAAIASLVGEQYGIQIGGNDIRDLVETVIGVARTLVAECWIKKRKK